MIWMQHLCGQRFICVGASVVIRKPSTDSRSLICMPILQNNYFCQLKALEACFLEAAEALPPGLNSVS